MSRADKITRSLQNLTALIQARGKFLNFSDNDYSVLFKEYPAVISSALFIKDIEKQTVKSLFSYKLDLALQDELSRLLLEKKFDKFHRAGKSINPERILKAAENKYKRLKSLKGRLTVLSIRRDASTRLLLLIRTAGNDRLNKQELSYFTFALSFFGTGLKPGDNVLSDEFGVYDSISVPLMVVEIAGEDIVILFKNTAMKSLAERLAINSESNRLSEIFREKNSLKSLVETLKVNDNYQLGKAATTIDDKVLRLKLKFRRTVPGNRLICEVHDQTFQDEIQSKYNLTLSRVSALIQNMQSGLLVEDEDRKMIVTNLEFCRMFSIPASPEDLIGMDCRVALEQAKELFQSPDEFIKLVNRLLEEKKISSGHELRLKDGRYFILDYIPVYIEKDYAGHMWNYRDVTDEVCLRQELRETGERYKNVVDSAKDIIFEVAVDGRIIFVNKTFSDTTGYSPEEACRLNYLSLVEKSARNEVQNFYRQQLSQNIENTYRELPVITKSGETIWVGQNATLIYENNSIKYFLVISRNISEIKAAQKQIADLKQFYETILRDLPGQIAVFDKDLKYIFVNPASVSSSEIRQWLIGKDDFEYCRHRGIDESFARRRQEKLRYVRENQAAISFEESFIRDGKQRTIIRTISPIYDEQRNVRYLIGYGLDITELKEAELAIRKSENQLNAVLDAVGEGIITINRYSDIIQINNEIVNQFGYTKEELIGQKVHLIMPEEFRGLHDEGMLRYMSTRKSRVLGVPLELEAVKKDGTRFPIQIKIQKTEFEKQPVFTAAIIDISENKKIIQELIQAKQLAEESTRAKEQFLAHMSHEIRTPMNAIVGLVNLMLQMKPEGKTLEYLTVIKKSTDNLLVIINDILDFSKITAGKIELEKYDFCLDKIFDQIVQIMLPKAEEKSLRFIVNRDSLIPPVLIGDRVRLGQILLNLVSNAIKFTEWGGVTLTATLSAIEGNRVKIKFIVSDTGAGIPEEHLETIFESFRQIGGVGRTNQIGTGLGLSITKLLVEMQGGSITVESKVGKGSTFIAKLSYEISSKSPEEFEEKVVDEVKGNELEGKKILIAEDNEFNRLVITNYLEIWGAEYETALNGKICTDLLLEKPFDLVLMDLGMPVMDGYEAARYIRQNLPEPANKIPIIALTASALLDVKNKVLAAGMNDYVSKPFKPQVLIQKILKCLGAESVEDEVMEKPEDAPDIAEGYNYLDIETLNDTAAGDSEFIVEILSQFITQIEEHFRDLDEYLSKGSRDELQKLLHKAKSSFGYVGLKSIATLFDRMERDTIAGVGFNQISLIKAQVMQIWEKARIEILDVLENNRQKLL